MSDPRPAGTLDSADTGRSWNQSELARYVLAVASVAASALLTFALRGAFRDQAARIALALFYIAILVSAWYGGRGPGFLAIVLSAFAGNYFFIAPYYTLSHDSATALQTAIFVFVSVLIVLLTERSRRAERQTREARDSLVTTLRSIGDAVISTDAAGRVEFMNPVAERLTGWTIDDARGRHLKEVFRIVNEQTRAEVESPAEKVLREGVVVGLANHTVLVARGGVETPIDDSGAPIRDEQGRVSGVVLVFHDISERRKTEAERAKLASIVESSDDAIFSKALDGTITSWNAAAERMYGYTAEEAMGQHISLIVPPELAGELQEIMSRLRCGESVERLETTRVRKGGERIAVSVTISPIRDPSGAIIGASTIARDITGQKRAEEERARLASLIERERERLRNLVADVPGVVWEAWGHPYESDQHINFVSDYVERMLGYTVEEWLHTPNFWLTIVHPEDREGAARNAAEHFERGGMAVNRFRWIHKDGHALWIESQSSVITDSDGRPVGMRGVSMDITARKAAEERLRFVAEASRVLASSLEYEATLERLAQLATAALADYCVIDLVDASGIVRRVAASHADAARQPLVERLRDFPPMPSRHSGVPRVMQTGHAETVSDVTDEVIAGLAQTDEHARVLRELGLKSYLTVPLAARGRTIGALTFASTRARRDYSSEDIAYVQDIASRAALAIDNARLYRRAQEVNRAKDEFLATLSHELRTPLTPILGWTHMIRSGRLGEAEVAQGIRVIEKNSNALSRLINDLLDMSSILSGKMRIERAPVELSSVVREATETVRPLAEARRVALDFALDTDAAPLDVDGDRTRLVQVFWNLLNNAVKFSPEGGRVRVRVAGSEGGEARVLVEDEGSGIEPEFLPHVFERFRQADMGTTRAHGGLGIGLALVKSFVEAHGGTVSAESAGAGHGSRFVVSLPASESAAPQNASGELAEQPECIEEPCRILLVEDSRDTLDMLRVVFEARGYSPVACESAEEAIDVAETGRFDIIVSDIGLPQIDGYELIERLRRLPHMREVPALALTGYAAPRDAEAALAAGFDAHLPKPIDPSALAEQVEKLLRRKDGGPALS